MLPPPRKVWTGQFATFPCPVCGGKVFDNTKDKLTPRSADYKCGKCGWKEWIPNTAR